MNDKFKKHLSKYLLLKNKSWYKNLNRIFQKMLFPIIGLAALTWFLIRVIPKPSRATYPCIQAAAPLASSFILYLLGLVASIIAFGKVKAHVNNSKYLTASLFIIVSIVTGLFAINQISPDSYADQNIVYEFKDPLEPNNPIGEAKGILPGRVVWVYNSDATNENCTNENLDDFYWLDENCDQEVVDDMFSKGIKSLTGKETHAEAWDAIFKYFNVNHGKGEIGYIESETIFIKINCVSAYAGIGNSGNIEDSFWPWQNKPSDSDTSPQTVLSILRHLVNEAGVPEEKIYIGDPIAGIWNHLYNVWSAEFPNIHYMDADGVVSGRTKLIENSDAAITYSDKGNVLNADEAFSGNHHLFESMKNSDYLINIPSMKGHRWGGVTLFAKNHFGSNTTDGSWQLHRGLMKPEDDEELRTGYSKYRVLVDLMGSKYLGGNTLLYFMDGLWSTSYEHQLPQKFMSFPFENDWSSSLLFSLDHVAIESVCIDILQKEFTAEDLTVTPPRYIYVQYDGVDDHLHQAASSDWWPEGFIYDPDNSGTPIQSLGTHEHWNNIDDMEYSRNLGTGEGIELIKIFTKKTDIDQEIENIPTEYVLYNNYPNPFNPTTKIRFAIPEASNVTLTIFNMLGQEVMTLVDEHKQAGSYVHEFNASNYASGIYIYSLKAGQYIEQKKMLFMK